LCDKQNLSVVCAIELDDMSHGRSSRQQWTVWIYDVADEGRRRQAQRRDQPDVRQPVAERVRARVFAGRQAHELDAARVAELTGFTERGLEVSGVPGTSVGIIQDGEVFSGGFGGREFAVSGKSTAARSSNPNPIVFGARIDLHGHLANQ
jgi:hypothetical protein